MTTKQQIHKQLRAMKAPQNSVVLMHTSLKAVGETEGRGEGLLEALIDYFTADGGLFCVPTHTWRNLITHTVPTMDMASDATCVGTFPSIALRHPGGQRSLHPSHSMVVFGDPEAAKAYIKPEETNPTQTGPTGCYGQLCERGGYVLLAGVGHNRNTYLHSVEEMMGTPNRLTDNPEPASIRLKSGEIIEHPLRCHQAKGIGDVSARFPKYEPAFRHHGCITDGFIGEAKAQLCDARKMRDVMMLITARSGGTELLADYAPLDEALYR